MKKFILLSLTLFTLPLCVAQSAPFGTGITYQGRLTDGGNPANGSYDFQFRLFDAAEGGGQVPVVMVSPNVGVTNGLFTTGFDFGTNVFDGTLYWLEVGVRSAGSGGSFTFLTPRQPLTPAPNALFSANAALAVTATTATTANGLAASVVSPAQLNTPGLPANGQVLSYSGTSLVWTNAATVATAWTLNGNAGTTAGVNFLGTIDSQALEFRVNGTRALRVEPTPNESAVNIIGGSAGNFVAARVVGATISGGGSTNYLGFIATNEVSSDFGTVGGGLANGILPEASYSTIGGGAVNKVNTYSSTISGGFQNVIEAGAGSSTVGGGDNNAIDTNASGSTIGGGSVNRIGGYGSVIGGGYANLIGPDASRSTICGGDFNRVEDYALDCTISGGESNTIQNGASYATISGGLNNAVQGFFLCCNTVSAASIGGGLSNTVSDMGGTIGGGQENRAFSYGTIAGGLANTAANEAAVGGGVYNAASGTGASISGGFQNTARGGQACVAGGSNNVASGVRSFAAGTRAKAREDGTFVWADSTDADFTSGATNEFAVRATGGARFVSGVDSNGVPVAGVALPAGGGSWLSLSDRNAKTNFTQVNPRELLDRLAQLPIQSWNYKSQSESVRHIGPTAQDFAAAFTVGEDDQHIATVDADGVALAAIQGLNQKLTEELKQKQTEITELKQRLDRLEAFLGSNNGEAK